MRKLARNEYEYNVNCGDCGGGITYIVSLVTEDREVFAEYVDVGECTCTCTNAPRVVSIYDDASLTPQEQEQIGDDFLKYIKEYNS